MDGKRTGDPGRRLTERLRALEMFYLPLGAVPGTQVVRVLAPPASGRAVEWCVFIAPMRAPVVAEERACTVEAAITALERAARARRKREKRRNEAKP